MKRRGNYFANHTTLDSVWPCPGHGGPPSELMRLGSGAVIDRSLDADEIVPSLIKEMSYGVNPSVDFVFPRT